MKTIQRRTCFSLAALAALAVSVQAQPPAPSAAPAVAARARAAATADDPAWPRTAVADPTTLGFTRAGLDAKV